MECLFDDATQCKYAPLPDSFSCETDCKYFKKMFGPEESFIQKWFWHMIVIYYILLFITTIYMWIFWKR